MKKEAIVEFLKRYLQREKFGVTSGECDLGSVSDSEYCLIIFVEPPNSNKAFPCYLGVKEGNPSVQLRFADRVYSASIEVAPRQMVGQLELIGQIIIDQHTYGESQCSARDLGEYGWSVDVSATVRHRINVGLAHLLYRDPSSLVAGLPTRLYFSYAPSGGFFRVPRWNIDPGTGLAVTLGGGEFFRTYQDKQGGRFHLDTTLTRWLWPKDPNTVSAPHIAVRSRNDKYRYSLTLKQRGGEERTFIHTDPVLHYVWDELFEGIIQPLVMEKIWVGKHGLLVRGWREV